MTTLPRTPTARLRFVADILETHPEHHDQRVWWRDADNQGYGYDFDEVKGIGAAARPFDCKTAGCVAGWAVASTPLAEFNRLVPDAPNGYMTWEAVGQAVLGIPDRQLSSFLFHSSRRRKTLIKALRGLAEMPQSHRTLDRAIKEKIVPRSARDWL